MAACGVPRQTVAMALKHHSANSGGPLLGAFGLKLWRGFARAGPRKPGPRRNVGCGTIPRNGPNKVPACRAHLRAGLAKSAVAHGSRNRTAPCAHVVGRTLAGRLVRPDVFLGRWRGYWSNSSRISTSASWNCSSVRSSSFSRSMSRLSRWPSHVSCNATRIDSISSGVRFAGGLRTASATMAFHASVILSPSTVTPVFDSAIY